MKRGSNSERDSVRFAASQQAVRFAWTPLLIGLALLFNSGLGATAAVFYVHPTLGSDDNSGTSELSPWQTLERASKAPLRAGDQLLLAAGQKFNGQLKFDGLIGEAGSPIVFSAYAAVASERGSLPVIDAKGFSAGVNIRNSSHVELRNVAITGNGGGLAGQMKPEPTAMRCGVLVESDRPGNYAGFVISNVVIRDVFFENPGFVRVPEEVRTANGTENYGWGIRFIVHSPQAIMNDVRITDCEIRNVDHTGLKLTAPSNGLRNVTVDGIRIANTGGPGVQMSGVQGGRFSHLDVNSSGSTNDTRNWKRGSGLWTWGSSDVVIEKSRFANANGPGDSAGVHIDYNCRDVIVQHNFSANNAGGFCEILGNNYNCAYRYNISVNDGYRIKGRDGAFQEGKTFWLSGYTGDKNARQGPFNSYFYNNTIYVGKGITAKFAITPTAQGVLIANNVFCIEGQSELVAGDQSRQDLLASNSIPNVVFQNNLYLKSENWPAAIPIRDAARRMGDPNFPSPGGLKAEDYIPRNVELVRNRGIQIPLIPGDSLGLAGGLQVKRDILGRRVSDTPSLGAIEPVERGKPQFGFR